MEKEKIMQGKPYAENPHVRFDEGAGAPRFSRCSALLYYLANKLTFAAILVAFVLSATDAYAKNDGLVDFGEAWPEERWDTDLAMMEELGINLVRMGDVLLDTPVVSGSRMRVKPFDVVVCRLI